VPGCGGNGQRCEGFAPPDLGPLGWARAAIGALILLRTTPLLAPLHIWFLRDTVPLLGWPHAGDALPLPHTLVGALCVLRTTAAAMLMAGVMGRVAGLVSCFTGYAVMAQDPLGYIFTLHLLYQAALLLGISDASAIFALRPSAPRSPRSSVLMMRLWIASIYVWAGFSKMRVDWLDGRTLDLLQSEGTLRGSAADVLLQTAQSRAAVATTIAAVEVLLGPALLSHATRRPALIVAIVFHSVLELSGHPDLLGWGMLALLLCFLGGDTPRQVPDGSQRMASNG
jgi:uncharacterized membrane protein YphA (DoxX/SURF4 family)